MKKKIEAALLIMASCLLLATCGGGGGNPPPPQKTATITFAIFANSTTHILGVNLSARLPAGVDVALQPGTVLLRQPDLSSTQGLIQGTYSASSRKVNLDFAGNSSNAGNRPFATLTCTVEPGVTLTQESFTSINNPFPSFLAVGVDPATASTITTNDVLMGKITPAMTVGFGF